MIPQCYLNIRCVFGNICFNHYWITTIFDRDKTTDIITYWSIRGSEIRTIHHKKISVMGCTIRVLRIFGNICIKNHQPPYGSQIGEWSAHTHTYCRSPTVRLSCVCVSQGIPEQTQTLSRHGSHISQKFMEVLVPFNTKANSILYNEQLFPITSSPAQACNLM